jgi:hypothetical protein
LRIEEPTPKEAVIILSALRERLEKTFQSILVHFQLIPDLPGRENPGKQDASRNGLGLVGEFEIVM